MILKKSFQTGSACLYVDTGCYGHVAPNFQRHTGRFKSFSNKLALLSFFLAFSLFFLHLFHFVYFSLFLSISFFNLSHLFLLFFPFSFLNFALIYFHRLPFTFSLLPSKVFLLGFFSYLFLLPLLPN